MKILQIIYESFGSPFGFGGAGVRAYEIYRRLKDRHDITLVCMKYPGARDGEIEGLRHVFLGTESRSLTKSVLTYTAQTANFVRKHGAEFDVIIENFLPSTPFFSRFLTKTPVILQIQDFWGKHTFRRYPLRFALPMYLVERCYPSLYRQFLFVSEVTRKRFGKACKTASLVIPNGVSEGVILADTREGNYILFISSIDFYKKGIDLLLEAFLKLRPVRDIDLVIAGSGRDMDIVKAEVAKLPSTIKKDIRLPGWVSGDEKTRLISGALFVVLPSRHESSPISILEAAACGKPLITSDIAELNFVEKNNIGVSFVSGSVKGLNEQMELMLKNPKLRGVLGSNGREYAGQFLWDNIAVEFENTLQAMVVKENIKT